MSERGLNFCEGFFPLFTWQPPPPTHPSLPPLTPPVVTYSKDGTDVGYGTLYPIGLTLEQAFIFFWRVRSFKYTMKYSVEVSTDAMTITRPPDPNDDPNNPNKQSGCGSAGEQITADAARVSSSGPLEATVEKKDYKEEDNPDDIEFGTTATVTFTDAKEINHVANHVYSLIKDDIDNPLSFQIDDLLSPNFIGHLLQSPEQDKDSDTHFSVDEHRCYGFVETFASYNANLILAELNNFTFDYNSLDFSLDFYRHIVYWDKKYYVKMPFRFELLATAAYHTNADSLTDVNHGNGSKVSTLTQVPYTYSDFSSIAIVAVESKIPLTIHIGSDSLKIDLQCFVIDNQDAGGDTDGLSTSISDYSLQIEIAKWYSWGGLYSENTGAKL